MDVRNCKMCGRLFNVLNNERICPACQKKLEDKFHEVKEYLEEHPGASVEQTATDNDISTKQIRQWVREERLILSTATEAGIVCEKCGKPIRTGRSGTCAIQSLNFYFVDSLSTTSYDNSVRSGTVSPSICASRFLQASIPSSLALKDNEVIDGILFSSTELL